MISEAISPRESARRQEPTPARILDDRARLTPAASAYVDGGARFTFGEAAARVRVLAGWLSSQGVEPGDRILLVAKNGEFAATTVFAASHLGAAVVMANWRLSPAEIAYVVDDSRPSAVLYDSAFEEMLDRVTRLRGAFSGAMMRHGSGSASVAEYGTVQSSAVPVTAPAAGNPSATAVIMYTSGTTGRPKGAEITGANLFWSAQGMSSSIEWEAAHRFLLAAPMFHIGGLAPLFANVLRGSTTVFLADFDPVEVWETIRAERITTMMTVPAMLAAMAQAAATTEVDATSLVNVTCGGSAVPVGLIDTFTRLGVDVQVVYGLTEFSGGLAYYLPSMGQEHRGSQGRPVFYADVAIIAPDTERRLPDGQVGEIICHGPQRFAGYLGNPRATREALTSDGWYRTGDVGFIDEAGMLTVVDRIKDMIISGGENIYPAEVEAVLLSHPAIADAAVVGVADEKWGEVPVAYVVADPSIGEYEILQFTRERLARYKQPKRVEVVQVLPRNAVGKIQKGRLREH
ncbi:class I adenylate-forming enzyme family protein [Gordonia sp. VNK21]|uniref:class I adenylate-forming enzyme family protein n=1 Tax=Gordonia sp. VNK21 TaxID=3382483 RepID=UPI0038D44B9E